MSQLNIVGPPLNAVADWRNSERSASQKGSDSFDRVLAQRAETKIDRETPKSALTEKRSDKAEKPDTRSGIERRKNDLDGRMSDKAKAKGDSDRIERSSSDKVAAKKEREETKASENSDRSEKTDRTEKNEKSESREVNAKLPGKKATGAREKAIQKFMDSFESEFGVPPTRIVEAMANLNPQKLEANPENSATEVIESLGLEPQKSEQAKAMYSGLLGELSEIDRKSQFSPGSGEVLAANSVQERFALNNSRAVQLRSGLDKLNDKFWMKGVSETQAKFSATGPDGINLSREMQDRSSWIGANDPRILGQSNSLQMPQGQGLGLDGSAGLMRGNSSSLGEMADADGDQIFVSEDEAQRLVDEGLIQDGDIELLNDGSGQVAIPKMNWQVLREQGLSDNSHRSKADEMAMLNAEQLQQRINGNGLAGGHGMQGQKLKAMSADDLLSQVISQRVNSRYGGPEVAIPNAAAISGMAAGSAMRSGSDSSSDSSSDSGSDADAQAGAALAAGGHSVRADRLEQGDFAAALGNQKPVAVTQQDHEANVKQLMNQAQYLIKKGGGEVKVKMTPEGLGDVHLKIAMNEGKVQVQIQAESNDAKKALESGLADLKSSLAAHKLAVDNVKVDVVHKSQADNQTNLNMNLNSGSQRQELRQFWNQFQDSFGNRARSDAYTDFVNGSSYTVRRGDPLRPIEDAQQSKSARADGRGRSVDLVA